MDGSSRFKSLLRAVPRFLRVVLLIVWNCGKFLCLNKVVRTPLLILWTIWPIILLLVVSFLSLNLMDQMQDLLDTLVQNFVYSCSAFVSLLFLSLTTWYCTQILFILRNQQAFAEEQDNNGTLITARVIALKQALNKQLPELPRYARIDTTTLQYFTYYTPIVLGLVPFASLSIALGKATHTTIHFIVLIIVLLLYLAIVYPNRIYTTNGITAKSIIGQSYHDLLPLDKQIIRALAVVIILLAILATIRYTNIIISSTLGPISVIFLALAMWMVIASFFNYLDYRFQTPFTLICLIWMVLFNNNNHQIRTIEGVASSYIGKSQADTVPAYFKQWLQQLLEEQGRKASKGGKITPVYLIATEGGGIRSAYWTAAVLAKLDSLKPNFYRHTFAVSGVSGGSVGAVLYTAQHRDHLQNHRFIFDENAFFDNDFLSPLLTAMLIPDMLQKFSPVGFNQLDRARYLEDSWESAYMDSNEQKFVEVTGGEKLSYAPFTTLSEPFMDLWLKSKIDIRFKTPILFLNATLAETGRKGILTPLSISNDYNFKNVIDIQETVYRHIPLKTAASISARFPLVTPPATIPVINEAWKDAGNFVDGGYLDNSGTTTLLSILSSITYDKEAVQLMKDNKVVIKIITINNSPELDNNEHPEALRGTYELRAPLQAFFKSWDNSGDARQYAVREYLRGFSGVLMAKPETATLGDKEITHNVRMRNERTPLLPGQFIYDKPYSFNLNRKIGIIPLGWDLSLSAEARIRQQAKLIPLLIKVDKEYQSIFDGLN